MVLYPRPGQVWRAGCPLTCCWCAVRAAAYAGSLMSCSSQRARFRISSGTAAEAVVPDGRCWWIASARSRPAFRSAAASGLPAGRSPCKIGSAKYPPVLGCRFVHLQLICRTRRSAARGPSVVLVKDGACGAASGRPRRALHRRPARRMRAVALNGAAHLRRPVNPKPAVPGTADVAPRAGRQPLIML